MVTKLWLQRLHFPCSFAAGMGPQDQFLANGMLAKGICRFLGLEINSYHLLWLRDVRDPLCLETEANHLTCTGF